MHRLQELVRLHRMGLPARQIAKELGMGPNTERRYRQILADAGLLAVSPARCRNSTCSAPRWNVHCRRRFRRSKRFRRSPSGERTSSACMPAEPALERSTTGCGASDLAFRAATQGEAQVDFGYLGHLYDPDSGRQRKAWVFLLVLVHSRRMVARIAFDQSAETWSPASAAPAPRVAARG